MPETPYRRQKVVHILKDSQRLEELDLWPGDSVYDSQFNPLGMVNEDGFFVTFLDRVG